MHAGAQDHGLTAPHGAGTICTVGRDREEVAVVSGETSGGLPKCVILDIPAYTGPPLFEQPNDEEGNARRRYWVPVVPQDRTHDDRPWLVRRQVRPKH